MQMQKRTDQFRKTAGKFRDRTISKSKRGSVDKTWKKPTKEREE